MAFPKIEKLDELVSKYIEKNTKIVNTKITRLTAPGENYGSIMLKVDLTLKNEDNSTEDLNVVAKLIPETEYFRNLFNIQVAFKIEMAFYNTIVPTLQEFQRKQGANQVIDFFPKLIGARHNLGNTDALIDENAVILLENLKLQGYVNVDRHLGFDLATTKDIIKNLAQFHAVPLALKLLDPKIFEAKVKPYLACFNPSTTKPPRDAPYAVMLEVLKESDTCTLSIPKMEKIIKNTKLFPDVFREPYSTIAHRDMWVNNIMVKLENGKSVQNKFIDFQFYTYDSPGKDLIFFLITSVQLEVLKQHFDHLVEYYHQEFFQALCDVKCATSAFSYEKFLQEFAECIKLELGHALYMMIFIVMRQKGGPASSDGPTKAPDSCTKDDILLIAKERAWWAVEEFGNRGWLD